MKDIKQIHPIRLMLTTVTMLLSCALWGQRNETTLEKGWKFLQEDNTKASAEKFDDSGWQEVRIPHDWAIFGPFNERYDLQRKKNKMMTGRTGGLPYAGCGWYRTTFEVPAGKKTVLLFDGAMSHAEVFVNGEKVCYRPNGYVSFHCDVTNRVHPGKNSLAIRIENKFLSSRWYPGAGLYRNVHLITTDSISIPVWGTHITTPHIHDGFASIRLETHLENADRKYVTLSTEIWNPEGKVTANSINDYFVLPGQALKQVFLVEKPQLWSPETPVLYKAVTRVCYEGAQVDEYETIFGIRKIEFIPGKGFFLNGQHRKFKGVCNHHDLGPLGSVANESGIAHQIEMLKDMGCDAIRTSHNMPAPELVRLCDKMGMMLMVESFDEWDLAKCDNGYHKDFNEWAEQDMLNMIHCYRNNPSVIMWSVGNEVPSQTVADGYKVAVFLQDICHREDPTRPVTCGVNIFDATLENGFISVFDIPGINYNTWNYERINDRLKAGFVLGTETVSTVSSRGVYKTNDVKRFSVQDSDHHCSSYDLDATSWSYIPDIQFAMIEDHDWILGEFVWTGFDYIGEPTPYDSESWPNHTSMFGIIDLASIPKDRYYLYKSVWNEQEETLHILPHWNWEGNEGQKIPVYVYTSYPSAEVFLNGISQGRRTKVQPTEKCSGLQDNPAERLYRLMWDDIRYEPGELKVIAYDGNGNVKAQRIVKTAGRPHHLIMETTTTGLKADGKDLSYYTVSVMDKDGNLCPTADNLISFSVNGPAHFKATANGDPTCLLPFHLPRMKAFNGRLTLIIEAEEIPGSVQVKARAKGLKSCERTITTVQ